MVDFSQIPYDKEILHYKIVSQATDQHLKEYLLGEGQYGKVVLGWDTQNNRKVAVKIQPKNRIARYEKLKELLDREITLMQKAKSDNIVEFFHNSEDDENQYLFIELCDFSLETYITQLEKSVDQQETLQKKYNVIIDVIRGFRTLSSLNIIHRDIKPTNILILNGKAKIADFGFSKILEGDSNEARSGTHLLTYQYAAPELLIVGQDNKVEQLQAKCDVFSVGILILKLIFYYFPWNGANVALLHYNISNKPLIIPDDPQIDGDLKILLTQMLDPDYESRISWEDVFKSNFVQPRI